MVKLYSLKDVSMMPNYQVGSGIDGLMCGFYLGRARWLDVLMAAMKQDNDRVGLLSSRRNILTDVAQIGPGKSCRRPGRRPFPSVEPAHFNWHIYVAEESDLQTHVLKDHRPAS